MDEPLLLIPGPTNLSERVREVMSRPQIGHTSQQFYNEFVELVRLARHVFRNEKGRQFVFSGPGTIGMETSVVNAVVPGDRVLVVQTGYFGKRFAMLNETHGAKVDLLGYPDGASAEPDQLRAKLRASDYKAVFITHVDTSTSVRNPIRPLVEECRNAGVFSIVDSVCGLGGEPLDFDALGADIAFTASQKALASAPGAVLVAASKSFMEHLQKREVPIASYYMNLLRWDPIMDDPRMYLATPSVQVLRALRVALLELKEEGLQQRWARHTALGEMTRRVLDELGAAFVAREGSRSNTVTAFWVAEGTSGKVRDRLEAEHGVSVAKGISDDKSRMVRVGHFGMLTEGMLRPALESLASVLVEVGAVKKEQAHIEARR
jgi:alanine-glyoxylate transaminase / serine-glyoxylate transaminase / serine-pyruvate transaminase